jgi:hypothetical protein
MGEDIIQMSQKELNRVHIIRKVLERSLTQAEAGEKLNLSERQIRRLAAKYLVEGEKGLAHGLRGQVSKRRISDKVWEKILSLFRKMYSDFGPTFACEKLFERHKIKMSDETLRKKLIAEGLWQRKRASRKYRHWRERKHYRGEMLQMDGSHHPWLEGRADECVLMGYIDDATSKKSGSFYNHEGTLPAFAGLLDYIKENGLPQSIYVDRHSTYTGGQRQTIEDELNNRFNLSQFERACGELDIRVIHAHSAPAKGRIERSFKTDQDRLVKELRLAGIKTIKEGNDFLKEYWPKHNKRFAVLPVDPTDMHRLVSVDIDLNAILCIKTERVVRNDFTIAYKKKLYQIKDRNPGRKVILEERIDGTMLIFGNNRYLTYKPITVKPVIQRERKSPREIYHPPMAHPFKRQMYEAIRLRQSKHQDGILVTV